LLKLLQLLHQSLSLLLLLLFLLLLLLRGKGHSCSTCQRHGTTCCSLQLLH
jgi:hypothetical protein